MSASPTLRLYAPSERTGITARYADAVIVVLLILVTFVTYAITAGSYIFHQSTEPHFVLLANALLHGHLWIDPDRARNLKDVTSFKGQFYVSFPPLPAIVMLPFVAVFGTTFDDVLLSVSVGSLNVGISYLLIRRLSRSNLLGGPFGLGRRQAIALSLLFGFGTVHYYAAITGSVWFIAHVIADTCLLLYLFESVGRGRPFLAGAALAAAFLARTPAVFGLVFWVIITVRQSPNTGLVLPRLVKFAIPLGVATGVLLGQNVLRFGSPLDFGYLQMHVATNLVPDLRTWGQFSLHYLRRNLVALLIFPPIPKGQVLTWFSALGGPFGILSRLSMNGPTRGSFPIQFDPRGTGIWAVTPAVVFGLRRPLRASRFVYGAAWLTAVVVALPDVLYYNTGWEQYGYRFALDFLPFLLLLMTLSLRQPLSRKAWALFVVLTAVSIGSNFLGARWFLHQSPY